MDDLVPLAEVLQDLPGGLGDGGIRLQERGLVVESLPGVGYEDRGDAQGVADDEGGRRRVPCGISSGLESVPEPSARERGRVRLLLEKQLALELLEGLAVTAGIREGIVLLGRTAGKGLEPVRVVGRPQVHGPSLHTLGDVVGDVPVEGRPPLDGLVDRPSGLLRKISSHRRPVEDVASVIGGGLALGGHRDDGLLCVGILNCSEPESLHGEVLIPYS